MTLQYLLNTLKKNKTVLRQEYSVRSLRIFGSYAVNRQTEESDIDFLVEFNPEITDIFEAKYRLKVYLQSLFQKDVYLARSEFLKPYIKNEILSSACYAI